MKRGVLAMVLAVLLRAASAQAELSPDRGHELTIDEITRSVETSFPLLRAAERERVIADADVLTAEGGFDPSVKVKATTTPIGGYPSDRLDVFVEQPTAIWGTRFFGGWRYGRGSFAPYDGKYETADYGEGRIGAQVPLFRDGPTDRRRTNLAKAELGSSIASLSVTEQKLAVVRAASMRYWDWVAAGRRVAIAHELLAMATTRDAQLLARVESGDLPAYERAENLRVMHQREAQLAQAERALDAAAIELSLYLRTDAGTATIPPRARLPRELAPIVAGPPAADALEAAALASRPEPKRFDALLRQSRLELELAENQKKPSVDLFVMGSKDFGPGPPKIVPAELEVGLLLDIPILNRAPEGRRRAAEAQLARVGEQARYARDRVVAEARDASSAVERAKERAAAVGREVLAARSLVTSERERFELGESSLLMVNLREQAYAEAELREVDAVADHHRGMAALRAAIGTGQTRGPNPGERSRP